ncbi:glycosyltransferase family 2 protein [Parvularcula sp. LCG005]|uniref:glycosyltransferase n=1 Tax=Parvularcula sp. LCG005 TaxID=3078805 RepID=UPI0029422B6E|nr:glycosyltransferase family 2 protein [Parvularcula sp. LCG005]WOI54459.1 glycosyltransferase family 2 protein [Parvularcula sp. LCG005]
MSEHTNHEASGTGEVPPTMKVGFVVIGRNEGERLVKCLKSVPDGLPTVYVDSASTDHSIENAVALGAEVHSLDMSKPFSAARARNEGFDRLMQIADDLDAVHFLDGDTILQPGWLATATSFLQTTPKAAAIAGRRREIHPGDTWYNTLCDIEWDTPVGQADAIGGDALYRVKPFREAGGFNPTVIAGEEPELCFRMRKDGWTVHRLDAEMTLHDAAIHSFGAWWKRQVRAGYAWALGMLLHGREGYNVKETVRSLLWGLGLPIIALGALLIGWWLITLAIIALYGLKWFRLRKRFTGQVPQPGRYGAFLMMSNVAEVFGMFKCWTESALGERRIVEYK